MFSDAVLPLDSELFAEFYAPEEKTPLHRVRSALCVKIQQCKILPRLQKENHKKAGGGKDAKKEKPCYEIEGGNALYILAF